MYFNKYFNNFSYFNNFKFLVFSSASKRGLTTMDIISEVYNKELPIELFVDIHEFGGVYIGDQVHTGMTDIEIREFIPRINIPEDVDIKSGWWKLNKKETEEGFKERVKRAITKMKEIAVANQDDYTICIISHGLFLNALFTVLTQCELLVDSKIIFFKFILNLFLDLNFGFGNLSISSMTISKKKEVKVEFLNLLLENDEINSEY
jgi:broad specificity phosphatase PhoE